MVNSNHNLHESHVCACNFFFLVFMIHIAESYFLIHAKYPFALEWYGHCLKYETSTQSELVFAAVRVYIIYNTYMYIDVHVTWLRRNL